MAASPPPFAAGLSATAAAEALAAVVHQRPQALGLARTRWWLDGVRQVIDWLHGCCLATVWQTLRRADLHYKRGRTHVHSPDPAYAAKVATIAYLRQRAHLAPQQVAFLYGDELTYHRRASVGSAYALAHHDAPYAEQGVGANTTRRIAACLDVATGQLFSRQCAHCTVAMLTAFLQQVDAAYPHIQRLYLAWDNWPVHFHPQLLADLAATTRIRLVRLPTYAPWTNPVEKVWRKLSQEVLHLHHGAAGLTGLAPGTAAQTAWEALQREVQSWLEQWAHPAPDLLRYLGLHCPT